jgi:hypothetical protein
VTGTTHNGEEANHKILAGEVISLHPTMDSVLGVCLICQTYFSKLPRRAHLLLMAYTGYDVLCVPYITCCEGEALRLDQLARRNGMLYKLTICYWFTIITSPSRALPVEHRQPC